MFEQPVDLPGSHQNPPIKAQHAGIVPSESLIDVTVILRRRSDKPALAHNIVPARTDRTDFAAEHGADPSDAALIEEFARHAGMISMRTNLAKRQVHLLGTAEAMGRAFGIEWSQYQCPCGKTFRGRTGVLTIPSELRGAVIAILGLDNRPIAQPHFRSNAKPRDNHSATFTPPQLAALYNFPKLTGAGQTVGIIELGGGYDLSDLKTYFDELGLKTPSITWISVNGATNSPDGLDGADGEVQLDIEVVGAIANGANIAVYFAPNTDQGFVNAISEAVHDPNRKVSVVSISWGGPEDSWTEQARTALNAALQDAAALGVTVTVASGDNGSSDGAGDGQLHVDFPSSSPFALSCGGTTVTASGGTITSESVWNETANNEGAGGGGVSLYFPLPHYQDASRVPKQPTTNFVGRGVPDVCGNADPVTGYRIRVDGQDTVIGGTSAVAPLWAALIALINQSLGEPVGFLNPKLYALSGVCNDITSGNNDDSGLGYYSTAKGWDPCTGQGSPNGEALLKALKG